MLAISRFRVPPERTPLFVERARAASEFFRGRPGCQGVDVVQNLDDAELWSIVTRWSDVGSYRRSFNGNDAKIGHPTLIKGSALDEVVSRICLEVVLLQHLGRRLAVVSTAESSRSGRSRTTTCTSSPANRAPRTSTWPVMRQPARP